MIASLSSRGFMQTNDNHKRTSSEMINNRWLRMAMMGKKVPQRASRRLHNGVGSRVATVRLVLSALGKPVYHQLLIFTFP